MTIGGVECLLSHLKVLFECCRIHFNPCVLVSVEIEFSSSSTPIHSTHMD
jgi:hypothetical protein